jgi:hypothetical protein
MAALDTSIYLTPPYSVTTGPFGAVAAGTAPTTNVFTPLFTFPFAVEILGFSMNRGATGAPTSGMTFTCGYAAAGTSAAGGVTACGAAFTDVATIGTQRHTINDNGATTGPTAYKPIVVPAGNSIGFLASNHATTNSVFNGFTILYRPAQ